MAQSDMSRPIVDGSLTACFKEYINSGECCLYSRVCNQSFVLFDKLRVWLETPCEDSPKVLRLRKLLDEAFQPYPDRKDKIASKHEIMEWFRPQEPCMLKLFCLLVLNGAGHLVQDLAQTINDRSLPLMRDQYLRVLKGRVESDQYATTLAAMLLKDQWRFCPPQFGQTSHPQHQEEEIIPITTTDPVKTGGVATVWRIEVPDEYVNPALKGLMAEANTRTENGILFYRFALKSFKKKEQFELERKICKKLEFANNSGMVKYICDYERIQTHHPFDKDQDHAFKYNLVTELCDIDLWEQITNRQEPQLPDEISGFWFSFFPVLEGLARLHNFDDPEGVSWLGWHTDVKPENIMRAGNQWKLGDFGFAKFERPQPDAPAPKTLIQEHTKTWGPPETHLKVRSEKVVTQSFDIWSLGCVLSATATWIVRGPNGVHQYKRIREAALTQISRDTEGRQVFEGSDQFHDSQKVLQVVTDWHNYLRMSIRNGDTLTGQLLDIVDKNMLLTANHRSAAGALLNMVNSIQRDWTRPTFDFEFGSGFRMLFKKTTDVEPLYSSISAHDERPTPPTPPTQSKGKQRDRSVSFQLPRPPQSLLKDEVASISLPDGPPPGLKEDSIRKPTKTLQTSFPLHPSVKNEEEIRRRTIFQVRRERDLDQSRPARAFKHILAKVKISKASLPFNRDFYYNFIKNRDFILLVDNSTGMKDHWGNVMKFVEGFIAEVAECHDDGLDMKFALSGEREAIYNGKEPEKFLQILRKMRPKPSGNILYPQTIPQLLEDAFSEYQWRVAKAFDIKRVLPKDATIFVLTNGLWALHYKERAKEVILNIVESLKRTFGEAKLSKRPFTIQFVQFGEDVEASKVLQELDDDLEIICGYDIIDWEPWNGRIVKIILGSVYAQIDSWDAPPSSVTTRRKVPVTPDGDMPQQPRLEGRTHDVTASGGISGSTARAETVTAGPSNEANALGTHSAPASPSRDPRAGIKLAGHARGGSLGNFIGPGSINASGGGSGGGDGGFPEVEGDGIYSPNTVAGPSRRNRGSTSSLVTLQAAQSFERRGQPVFMAGEMNDLKGGQGSEEDEAGSFRGSNWVNELA